MFYFSPTQWQDRYSLAFIFVPRLIFLMTSWIISGISKVDYRRNRDTSHFLILIHSLSTSHHNARNHYRFYVNCRFDLRLILSFDTKILTLEYRPSWCRSYFYHIIEGARMWCAAANRTKGKETTRERIIPNFLKATLYIV